MRLTRKHLSIALAAFAVFVVVESWIKFHGKPVSDAHAAEEPQAVQVDVAAVLQKEVTDWQSYSGRLQAVDSVNIHALVPGTITAVYFSDGALVKKGDALFLIDPRPYVAAVDQAEAQLGAARARAIFTASDYTRAQKLIADNAIAKRDFDQKANEALAGSSDVKAAAAMLESAQINLGYTRINAPVAGRVSRAEITVGNVISAGPISPALTKLVSVSPIYASFDVDEQTYLKYLSQDGKKSVPVRLGFLNESGYSRMGHVASVDNQLNTSSGTIRVRATFDNTDGSLLPGLYARVAVGGGSPHPAILIDDRAVSTDQAKKFVLVVDSQDRAQYREVIQGEMYEGLRIITNGLRPGERVIVSGLQHVHPGIKVKPDLVPMSGENTLAKTP